MEWADLQCQLDVLIEASEDGFAIAGRKAKALATAMESLGLPPPVAWDASDEVEGHFSVAFWDQRDCGGAWHVSVTEDGIYSVQIEWTMFSDPEAAAGVIAGGLAWAEACPKDDVDTAFGRLMGIRR